MQHDAILKPKVIQCSSSSSTELYTVSILCCVTPAGTTNELDVRNELEENTLCESSKYTLLLLTICLVGEKPDK